MQAAEKIESFCLSHDEMLLFAGDIVGRIHIYKASELDLIGSVVAHGGTIIAMASSPSQKWFVCLSMDKTVSFWSYDDKGSIIPLASAFIRNLRPANDPEDISIFSSNAQTLGVHDTQKRVVTRSGNGGIA